jgi:hypothetical protein
MDMKLNIDSTIFIIFIVRFCSVHVITIQTLLYDDEVVFDYQFFSTKCIDWFGNCDVD